MSESEYEEEKLADLLIKNVLPKFKKELILQSLLVYQADGEEKRCLLINRSFNKKTENETEEDTEPQTIDQSMASNGCSRRKRKICKPTKIPQNEDDTSENLESKQFRSDCESVAKMHLSDDKKVPESDDQVVIADVDRNSSILLNFPLDNLNNNNNNNNNESNGILSTLVSSNGDKELSVKEASAAFDHQINLKMNALNPMLTPQTSQTTGVMLNKSPSKFQSFPQSPPSMFCPPIDLSSQKSSIFTSATSSSINCQPIITAITTSPSTTNLNTNGIPRPIRPRIAQLTMLPTNSTPLNNSNNSTLLNQQQNTLHLTQGQNCSNFIGSIFNNINLFPANSLFGCTTTSRSQALTTSLLKLNTNKLPISNNNNLNKKFNFNNGAVNSAAKNNVQTIDGAMKMTEHSSMMSSIIDENGIQSRRYAKSFVCNQCKSVFASLSSLCEHTFAIHKSFRCTICDAKFTQRSNLQRHSLRHVGFKPFICNICTKAYYRKDHLVRHIELSHPGANPRISITVKLSSAECLDFLEKNPPTEKMDEQFFEQHSNCEEIEENDLEPIKQIKVDPDQIDDLSDEDEEDVKDSPFNQLVIDNTANLTVAKEPLKLDSC